LGHGAVGRDVRRAGEVCRDCRTTIFGGSEKVSAVDCSRVRFDEDLRALGRGDGAVRVDRLVGVTRGRCDFEAVRGDREVRCRSIRRELQVARERKFRALSSPFKISSGNVNV